MVLSGTPHSELPVDSDMIEARICRVDRGMGLPLSIAQMQVWLSAQRNYSLARHWIVGLRFRGPISRQALRDALDCMVKRYETLRTTFRVEHDGQPVQVIQPFGSEFVLIEQELSADSEVLQPLLQEEREPFDLFNGPLTRGRLLSISDQEHVLMITQHPLISDHASTHLLSREVVALYCAFAGGQQDTFLPPDVQFADYASWERQQVTASFLEGQLNFWKQQLSGSARPLKLPSKQFSERASLYVAGLVQLKLSTELIEQIHSLAEERGITPFVILLSGWGVLLTRWSAQEEVIIGTYIENRRSPQTSAMLGSFENIVPVRIRLQENSTVEQHLRLVHLALSDARAHQDVPVRQAIETFTPLRGDFPVLQVMAASIEASATTIRSCASQLSKLEISEFPFEYASTPYELSLRLSEGEAGLSVSLEYAADLIDEQAIKQMVSGFQVLLERMVADVRQPISRLPILAFAECERLLYGFNDTTLEYPSDRMIHELVERQVKQTPDALAVIDARHRLTYSELNRLANQLAWHLISKGIGPDELVGISLERGVTMVVGLLGILKAGGAYLPLDPAYPPDRLRYILADAAPRVVISQEQLKDRLPTNTARVIALDDDCNGIARQSSENPDARKKLGLRCHNLAYVLYTSGSTGRPKGVAIEHRNTVNLISWAHRTLPAGSFDRTLLSTSLNFDLAVYECFVPLTTGGCVRVVENALALANESIDVTLINTVPSAIESMLNSACLPTTTRVVNLAGEVLKREVVERIFATSAVEQVCNLYGPSETTTYSTWISMNRKGGFVGSIGCPIANTQIYILDENHQPLPIGVAGEIYIGGTGVARGYLNRPEMTAERFVSDPFTRTPRGRLYKTGDMGCWRPDRMIEYLGRSDHQVKIRGYRIELGEIEAQLERYAGVNDAVVVVREDVPGERRLVAYITPRVKAAAPDVEEMTAYLKARLPEYMVPSEYVSLEKLPLTPNGKLDRGALPAPEMRSYADRPYEPPQGQVEELLADIWKELLRVKRVGRGDHFFDLGADSLSAMRLAMRIREKFAVKCSALGVFGNPTLQSMAMYVEGLRCNY